MKKITLTLLIIYLLSTTLGFAQQLESNHNRYNSGHNDLNSTYNDNPEEDDDILVISLANTYDTNNENTSDQSSTLDISESLIWKSNGADLNISASPVRVNLSSGLPSDLTTEVSYIAMKRIWKVVEVNENTPTASIKIPLNSIVNNSNPGRYYMFISESEIFDANSDFIPMNLDGNGNLETKYNFNGITFITFGFAPQISVERAIYFNGTLDYIDMKDKLDLNPFGFTISAWIKPQITSTEETSILSKRDLAFTKGYDLTLSSDNRVTISWKNDNLQSLSSNTSIPIDEWHHVAITYNGSLVSIYIDGVLDNSAHRIAPLASDASFLIAAAGEYGTLQYFKGHIDEVRVWDTELSAAQLRFIMNQELTNSSGQVVGKELPTTITKNDIEAIPWSNLVGYYPMSVFTYKNVVDLSGNGNDGQLKNLLTVDKQTAPLPYKSKQNGDWNDSSSWINGIVQYSPGSKSIVDPNITVDWNIVKVDHKLTLDNSDLPLVKNNNRTLLGLFVNQNQLLTLQGSTETHTGNGITITHYLELSGKIDLEGESQLIQTTDSDLNVISNGKIERDQQGTSDTFTYNYWSSPVTKENASYNSFKITDVMKDGSNPSNPLPINFSSSGYNGAPTSPIKIADYWIWKYANHSSLNLSSWQHIRRTGTIFPGEGFTMKGPGTGSIETQQNYIFTGKPNNGTINLTLAPNNDYLVGNPYPSAIDANMFIRDNGPEILNNTPNPNATPLISGTLYFWKHWGGGSHVLQDYQGGYATYNFSGGVSAASKGSNISNLVTQSLAEQKPGRYIPVGQGFFIIGEGGGTIRFNNRQRVFKKEENNDSSFLRNSIVATSLDPSETEGSDDRMKFRIGFNSINTIHRQLLLTIDENATTDVDWAYDGKMNESQMDDMFWIINDEHYIIQGSNEAEINTVYPLGIKTNSDGLNTIAIDELENVPSDLNIYLHDIDLDFYQDLRAGDYEIFLNAGQHLNRFEITFGITTDALGIEEDAKDSLSILYSNDSNKIILINPNQIEVKSIAIYNILGQSVSTLKNITQAKHSEYNLNNLSSGAYIIKLLTAHNSAVTKKILVE
jgi:hypothetical protein